MKPKKYEPFIPGYTGHLPLDYFDKKYVASEPLQGGHVPGYSGYVNKIKPENYFGQSFGKITTEINAHNPPLKAEFLTTTQANFVDQTKIKCKKASEIVGVNCPQKNYILPSDEELSQLSQTVRRVEGWETNNSENISPEESHLVLFNNTEFIGNALPGYTGHNRKVYATNIYGLSFKKAQETAQKRLEEDQMEKKERIRNQCEEVPPLFVSKRNGHQNR